MILRFCPLISLALLLTPEVQASDDASGDALRGAQTNIEAMDGDTSAPPRRSRGEELKRLQRILDELSDERPQPDDFRALDPGSRDNQRASKTRSPEDKNDTQQTVLLEPIPQRPDLIGQSHPRSDNSSFLDPVDIWEVSAVPPATDAGRNAGRGPAAARPQTPIRKGDTTLHDVDTDIDRDDDDDTSPPGPPAPSEGYTFRPFAETTLGYSTNAAGNADGKKSIFLRPAVGFFLRSHWSRHALNVDAETGYTHYFAQREVSTPHVRLDADGRIDVSEDTHIDLDVHYSLARERATRFNLQNRKVRKPTLVHNTALDARITRQFDQTTLSLRGAVKTVDYRDEDILIASIPAPGGAIIARPVAFSRDSLEALVALRASMGNETGVTPFIEAELSRHILRGSSPDKSSNTTFHTARVGATLDIKEWLSGEVALAYEWMNFSFDGIPGKHTWAADVDLTWTVSPLTRVDTNAFAHFLPSTQTNVFGTLTYGGDVALSHDLHRDVAIEIGLAYRVDFDYLSVSPIFAGGGAVPKRRTLRTFSAHAGLHYMPSPTVAISPQYSYTYHSSSIDRESSGEHRIGLRVRLQR